MTFGVLLEFHAAAGALLNFVIYFRVTLGTQYFFRVGIYHQSTLGTLGGSFGNFGGTGGAYALQFLSLVLVIVRVFRRSPQPVNAIDFLCFGRIFGCYV